MLSRLPREGIRLTKLVLGSMGPEREGLVQVLFISTRPIIEAEIKMERLQSLEFLEIDLTAFSLTDFQISGSRRQ